MASFGESLVNAFNATYGTLTRGALQAEQAAYFREQREGGAEFRRRDEELRRQYGIDPGTAPQAPQAPQAGQEPRAPGPVQSAVGATPPAPAAPAAPAAAPQPPAQGAVATAAQGQPAQRQPPVSPEDMEMLANRGDAVTQAALAGQIAPPPTGMPGQVNDTRAPAALAAEVAQFSGARGPLTRANWNAYYEARINDAMRLLPPDQAVRTVAMLDGLRQRGFGQAVSLAVAASQAGDAEGATRALTAASNFLPDGFKDNFRVVDGGRAIEMVRTPETGEGRPQSMVIPLNEVTRYATTMLDPKWSLGHQLDIRRQTETERSNRAREGQTAESLRLTREERTERREFDARGGQAINLTRGIARMEGEYEDAVAAGDNERADKLRADLDTERGKLTDVLARGVSSSAAAGMTRAETDAARTRIQARVAATRQQRADTMAEIGRDSLALRERALDEAMTKHEDRYDLALSRLSQQERIVAVREDNLRARVARDTARDEESKKRAEAVMAFTERRLRVLEGNAERRRTEVSPADRAAADRAYNEFKSSLDVTGAQPSPLLGRFAVGVFRANPDAASSATMQAFNDFFKDGSKFDTSPSNNFGTITRRSDGAVFRTGDQLSAWINDRYREAEARRRGAPGERLAAQEGSGQTSMVQPPRGNVGAALSSEDRVQEARTTNARELGRSTREFSDSELMFIVHDPRATAEQKREARMELEARNFERGRPNPPSARFRGTTIGE